MQALIKTYFKILSYFFPGMAANQAFELFQRTRPFSKRFRKRERPFYRKATKFEVPGAPENSPAYELGNPNGDLVILVHGWDSNAGSMGRIADILAEEGKRVVSFDLTAHGNSKLKKANIYLCRESLRSLIHFLKPTKPFDLITHSFGSAVGAFALSHSNYRISNWIMLSSPNRLKDIFREFKNGIGLGNTAFQYMENKGNKILNERISDLSVAQWVKNVKVNKLTILHDKFDRVLPFSNALTIKKEIPQVELRPLDNIGHYKMLYSSEVLKLIKERVRFDFEDLLNKKPNMVIENQVLELA